MYRVVYGLLDIMKADVPCSEVCDWHILVGGHYVLANYVCEGVM